jgi:hypothetical protein
VPLGELGRLDHDAVSAVVAVEQGALAEPGQHSDLREKLLLERRLKLTELVARTSVPCLHLVSSTTAPNCSRQPIIVVDSKRPMREDYAKGKDPVQPLDRATRNTSRHSETVS